MSKVFRIVVLAAIAVAAPAALFATNVDLKVFSVSGTPDPITLNTGNVTYTVQVFNQSGTTGTNTVLTNTLPVNSTYVSSSATGGGTCSQSAGTVTCNWSSIGASNNFFATIVVTPTSGGSLTLSASVTGTEPDPNTADNTGSKSVTVNSQIDLRVFSVSGTPDPMTLNTGNVTYTVQVFNQSTSQGTGTVLTSTLPVNSTYVSSSATGGGTCSQSAGTVTCNWSSIGASNNFFVTIVVTPTSGGSLTLSATVGGTEPDPNTADNTGSKSVTVNSQIDLRVFSVSGTPDPITLNTGNVTYTVQVFNQSTSQGTGTILTSTLPVNSTYVSSSATGGGTCSQSAGTVTCNWSSIGASNNFFVTIVVTPTSGGSLTLSATVGGTQPDPNTADNTGSKSVTVNSQIDLRVFSVSASPDPITFASGNEQFTIQVFNASTSQGTNPVLTVTLPSNSNFVSATATGGGTCSHSGGTATCNWTSIGASNNFFVTVIVTPTIPGTLTLSASVAGTEPDPNTANNTGSHTSTVTPTSCTTVPTGAEAWYRAENNGVDSIGPNFATANGGTTYTTGKVGQAFTLNGTTAYVSAPDNVTLRRAVFTIEGWFNLTGGTGTRVLVSKTAGTALSNSFLIFIAGDGSIGAGVGDSTTTDVLASATFPTTNAWHHFAYTYDGAVQALYLDGALAAASGTAQVIAYDTHPLLLGADIDSESPASFFPGRIDEVTMYNRVLTSTEIQTVFGAGTFGKCYVAAPAPSITGFTPGSGISGTSVAITGTDFTAVSSVKFNGTSATFTGDTSTQITATVPAAATTGTISVIAGGGTATSGSSFTVIPSAHWINSGGGNWSTPSNWSTGTVPTSATVVFIDANGTYLVTLDVAATVASLTVGGGTGTHTLTVPSVLTLSGTSTIASNGILLLNGGTLTGAGDLTVNGAMTFSSGTLTGAGSLVIPASGTMSITGGGSNKVIDSRTINNSGTITFAATGATFVQGTTVIHNLSGASFNIQSDGSLAFNGGTPQFNNGGTLTRNTATGAFTIGLALANNSIVDVQSGTLSLDHGGSGTSGTFTVSGGALLRFGVGYNVSLDSSSSISATGSVEASGAIVSHSGNYNVSGGTTVSAGGLTLTGTVSSLGPVAVSNGILDLSSSSALSTPSLSVTGGQLTGTSSLTVNGPSTFSSGTIAGSGTLVIPATRTMSITGGGSNKVLDSRTINNSGTITFDATGATFVQGTLVINNLSGGIFDIRNDGSLAFNGGSPQCNNSGTLNRNTTTGVSTFGLALANNNIVNVQSGTLSFDHGGSATSGTFSVSSGALLRFGVGYNFPLDSSSSISGAGSVEVSGCDVSHAGNYNISGGTATSGGTLTLTGSVSSLGPIAVNNGILDLSSASALSTSSLGVTGGQLKGTSSLTVNGPSTFSSGTIAGSGTLIIPATRTMSITGGGSNKVLDSRTIHNSGTITFDATGATFVQGTLAINNLTGGIFNIQSDGSFAFNGGSPQFSNNGTLNRNTTTGTSNFGLALANNNIVNVQSGTLSFDHGGSATSGTFSVSGGALLRFGVGYNFPLDSSSSISGAGSVEVSGCDVSHPGSYNIGGGTATSGGTLTLTGTVSSLGLIAVSNGILDLSSPSALSTSSLSVTGGQLKGTSSLTVNGPSTFSSGIIAGSGTLVIPATRTMSITGGGSNKVLDSRTINNSGTITFDATGATFVQGTLVINNLSGSNFTIQSDGFFAFNGGTPQFINSGTFTKSAGTGTSAVGLAMNNQATGTIVPQSGTISFPNSLSQNGTLYFPISSASGFGTIDISGTFSRGGILKARPVGGFIPPVASTYPIFSFGSVNGAFASTDLAFGTRSFTDSYTATTGTLTASALLCQPPPSGLVSWYRAEGNAVDDAGTNNGTLIGGATTNTGYVGQSFNLNGTTAYVSAADSPSLRPSTLTIEGWFNFSAISSFHSLASKPLGSGIDDSFALFYQSGQLKGQTSNGSGGVIVSTPFVPTTGVWYHLAYTFDGSTHALWINGTQAATAANTTAPAYDGNPLVIGADIDNSLPSGLFAGQIDELSLYSRALTAVEISDIYNASAAGKCYTAAAPSITTFSPNSGPAGTSVIITGASLIGTSTVTFGGTPAPYVVNSGTQITATVPVGATTGLISVTTAAGTASSASSFTVLAQAHWTNSSGGNWNTPSNWSTGSVPTSSHDVFIDAAGTYTVNLDVTPAFHSLTAGGGATGTQTLDLGVNHDVTFTNPGTVTANGALTFGSGRLLGSGPLTVNGVMNWNADAEVDTTVMVAPGGTLNINGAGTRYINGGTLNNSGTVNWSGGNNISIYNSGVINNLAAGLFSVTNDSIIYVHCCSGGQAFNNAGTFRKTVATNTTTITSNGFDNSGTVDIQSGILNLASGGTSTGVFNATSPGGILFSSVYTLGAGATLTGSGNFQLNSSQLIVSAAGVTVNHMTLAGGNLDIHGGGSVSTTATGVIDWIADATLSGAGTLNVAAGGTLNFGGSGTRYIDGGTLNNSGTVNWSGGNNISIYNSGVINNLAGGLFLVTNDSIIYAHCCALGQAFNNAGTFRKMTATSTTLIAANGFNNSGTVDIQSGTFRLSFGGTSTAIFNAGAAGRVLFNGAAYTLAGAATLTGPGNFEINGGLLNVTGSAIAVDHLTMDGGRLDVTGAISTTPAGVVDWSADSTLAGAGSMTIASGATMNITGSGTRFIDGGTLNNDGTVNWSGGNNLSIYNSGVINNHASALFDVTNDSIIYVHCCAPGQPFNNAGTFRKSVATNTTQITSNGFTNSGTLDVQSGTVNLTSGGTSTAIFNAGPAGRVLFNGTPYTLAGAATLTGPGNFEMNGGQLNVTGSAIAIDHLILSGGTLNVTGAISTTASGVVDWPSDSVITGAGSLTIASGATMNINGSGTRYIDGGALINNGTVHWSGGNNISIYNSGVINNQSGGLFDVTNDQLVYIHCCLPGQAFNNAGTFRKSAATNTTTFSGIGFTNSGTLQPRSGVISFNGGFTNSGSPAYDFGIGSATTYGRLTFSNPVALSGALIAAPVNSFVPQGGQQFTILSFPSGTATFSPKTLTFGSSPVRSFADSYSATAVTLTASGPTITAALSPNQGSDAGGTPVTITGSGFVSGGSLAVTFGGSAASAVTFVNSTTITCTTPAHAAGAVDVVLTNGDGQPTTATNGFTYLAPTDIAINGSAPATATNGGTFTYTTVVTNNGPAAASGVTATITLPPNVTLGSATSTQGTCSGATTITCSIGTLSNTSTATQTINLTATGSGTAVLNAAASAAQSDSNGSNNTTTSNVAIGGTATLFVTTNADSGTGSLRQAVLDANNASVCTAPCTIGFNLPGAQRLISPPTSLPAVTAANVTIDATTQPGYSGAPLVTLDGSSNPNPSAGLQLSGGSDTIKGLSIVSFQGSAIVIDTAGNDVIAANYIGLQTDGLTPGQNAGEGVLVTTANNTIGGSNAASRNVISGNFGSGVVLKGLTATGNAVRGNYIGLNSPGTSNVANITDGIQILLGASNSIIGGTTAADRNVISGNNASGIYITGTGGAVCSGNLISANFIGTNAAGSGSIGNSTGVYLGTNVTGNTIGGTATGTGNTIVSNTTGISFDGPGDANAILGNSITGNSGMTIDLGNNGPTANDAGDADSGPNEFQNTPTFVDASMAGSTLTAHVSVDSASVANTAGIRVELFKSDASGVHALSLLASQCFAGNALTGVAMTINSAPVVIGDKLVATATSYTDAACSTIADGTSELSTAATITTCTPPSATITPSGPTTFCTGGSVTLTASAGASYQWRNFATPIIGANAQQYVATAAGSYSVTITNAGGCSATSASTAVTVNSAVNVTISAGGPTTFCSGGNVTLTANPSGGSGSFASYQWLLNGSPIGGANATTYNATASGNYSVTVTDTSGCTGTSAPQSVSVTAPPSAAINAPASICANSSAGASIVSPVGGATYTWTVTNGSVTFGQGTSSIIFAAGTTSPISISVVASLGGCTANGSASVAVGAFTPTITGSNSFCPGGNTTLTASSANSYQWSLNGSPIGGATAQTYVAAAAGNYTVTESNASGCNGTSAPFAVSQAPLTPPTVTPGGPTTFCSGGSVTLTSSAAATYQWLINGNPIGGSTSQSINVTASGSYSVTITSGSCSATSSAIAVTVNPTPAVTITGPTAICAGGSATLDAGGGFATYAWSTGANTQTITVSPASTTAYSVTVTKNGCSATASKTITISSGATTATITAPSSVPTNSAGNTASVPAAQAGSAYNWTISGGTITSGNGTPSIVWTAGNSGTATISITTTSASCTASGSVNVAINDSADLALTMAATPNPVPAGGTVTFTLNAINNGPSDAQNVTVSNSLFGITAATASGNGWSCNVSGLSVVCTRPTLAAGAGAPVTITATVTGNSAGDAAAIATATSDPNTSNNSASASVSVTTQASCNNNAPALISPAAGASNLASSINFTWSAAANAMSYDLWIASSGAAAAIATTTQSTSAIINLPSGISTWYVAAHFPNGCPVLTSTPRDLTVAVSANCSQAAPQLIAPSPNATVNAPVTFSWTPVAQAIGYRLWLAIDGGAFQDAATTNGPTSVTLPLSGSNVVWHVDAIFPGCAPTSSPSSSFTLAPATGCASHAAPSLLAPAPNATLQSSIVDLQWTAAAGANGYRVWASINGAEFAPIATTQVTTLHVTFTTGSVTWYVEALFDGCASTTAAPQSFTIPAAQNCNNTAATPLAPANNVTLTNGFVQFDWTAAANTAGYELWLSIDGGAPSLAGTTTGTSLSRIVGSGTIEWYIRTLFDRCDAVDSAHFHFTIAPPANCSVTRPILTAPFEGAPVFTPFDLHWSSIPGATQYKVRLGSSADPQVIGTTSALHLDDVTAPAGPVTWSVEAIFGNCPPVRSTSSTFTAVAAPPPCSTPTVPQPRAGSTASTNINYVVRWTASGPKATTQYELQESTDAAFTAATDITTDANERSFTHANSGDAPVTYYYRVRAAGTCNGARSLFSPAIPVQVLPSNVTDPSNANGSTPADNPQSTHYQLHLGGGTNGTSIKATTGDTFTATTNQPWLTVTPSTGTVAPEGTTLNVTANTNGLPVGTSTAAVNVTFGSSTGSSRAIPLGTTPPATTTVSVNLVQPVSPTAKNAPPPDALIIPAVAHADGINSKFQSDVRVTNSSAQPMKYQVTFTPTGDTGITSGKQTTIDIDPGRTIALDDVLESWFGSNGATGTLEVRPLTTNTSTTTTLPSGLANLLTFASSRTFSTTSNGTFGQYIPAIPFAAFVGRASDPTKSTILSLQQIAQSAAYRTNLGIVEGSGDPASVLVSVFADDGHKLTEFTQDLKGGQHMQLNSILAQKNVQVNDGRIEIKVVSPAGRVTAYASVLDNLTNDPLLVTPVAVNATAAAKYVIPGVADLNNGFANWQTDVRLFNPSANIVKATLTFYSQSGAAPQSKDVSLAPNQVQTFDAALHQFFGLTNDGGALHISTTATTPLVATARTYNQTSNGTYGQFIPAVTANDAAALGTRPLQLLQIEESDRYRTNIGFAEVTGKSATVEVTAIPSDSKVAASTQINLTPNQFIQYPQLLKSMGLTNMYNARVTVKVISGQGRVTAYASVIDSKTNDPTFVPAQ